MRFETLIWKVWNTQNNIPRTIVKQNIYFAIGIKVIVLLFGAIGISTMWEAVFADVGVTLLTVVNSLRVLKKAA